MSLAGVAASLGISVSDLYEIHKKLTNLGLTTKDVVTILDCEPSKIIAMQKQRILYLEGRLRDVRRIVNNVEDVS